MSVSALTGDVDTSAFDAFFEHCIQRKFFPTLAASSSSTAQPWLHGRVSDPEAGGPGLAAATRRCGPDLPHRGSSKTAWLKNVQLSSSMWDHLLVQRTVAWVQNQHHSASRVVRRGSLAQAGVSPHSNGFRARSGFEQGVSPRAASLHVAPKPQPASGLDLQRYRDRLLRLHGLLSCWALMRSCVCRKQRDGSLPRTWGSSPAFDGKPDRRNALQPTAQPPAFALPSEGRIDD